MSSPSVQNVYVLSPLQQGLLFHSLSAPGAGLYVDQLLLDLAGEVDVAMLGRAWRAAVGRHDALRTSFHWRNLDKPLQVVHPAIDLPLAVVDWRALDRARLRERLAALCAEDRRRGFDVQRAPLLRLTLVRTGPASSTLLWTYHHLLLDAWSGSVLQSEVFAIYQALRQGGASPSLPPARPFADYIGWLRRRDPAAPEAYWRRVLRGVSGSTPFGVDRPAAPAPTTPEPPAAAAAPDHAESELELSAADGAGLVAFVRRHQLTLNTLVQGAWAVLLHLYSGEDDVLFGATVSGRPDDLPGVGSMVGLFINTLPVRVRVDETMPAAAWLQRLQGEQLEQLKHQHSALAEIQRWSELPPGRQLFESIMVFENVPGAARPAAAASAGFAGSAGSPPPPPLSGELEVRGAQYISRTNYPLILMIVPGERLLLRATYDRHRFTPEAPERLLGHLANLLRGVAALPAGAPLAALSPLSAAERRQLVVGWNDTAAPYPRDSTLTGLFARAAANAAERPAVEFDGVALTYAELQARAATLADRLRRLGVGAEEPVALCLEPSADLVTAMLGVLAAGGAYAPLDPSHPPERLAQLLTDLGTPLVLAAGATLATAETAARLAGARAVLRLDRPETEAAADPSAAANPPGIPATPAAPAAAPAALATHAAAAPDSLAAIFYTSGSTGRPKGVGVPHRAIVRLLFGVDYVALGPEERIGQLSNVAFDAATFEIWGALLHGGCLVGVPRTVSLSPRELAARLRRGRISTLFLTTSLFNQVAREAPDAFGSLRQLLFGGEAADAQAVAEVLRHDPPPRLLNLYGPTEGTTFTTWYRAGQEPTPDAAGSARASLPIGLPVANTTVHLLDAEMRPVPVAVRGELYIGGDGLARGYRGRPELTAERFLPDPFAEQPGGRLYRTGDLARRRADGAIEFAGRNDHQIKIRGFRVELGEIEAALLTAGLEASPGAGAEIAAAAVLRLADAAGDPRLVAFVAAPSSPNVDSTREGAMLSAAALPAESADLAARLRARLERTLPAVMVPAAIFVLPALPLTPNGKVDRAALGRLALSAAATGSLSSSSSSRPSRSPRSPVEELLAGIWSAVLGVEEVGAGDEFLRLGGHSLKVTQVLSRVREAFGIELPLADLFAASTLAEQAARIERELRTADPAAASAAGAVPLQAPPPLVPVGRDLPLPLSFAQQRLWILDRFDPGLPAYNIPFALHLTGNLAAGALAHALRALMQRHEALRTRFVLEADETEPVQRIVDLAAAPDGALRLPLVDLGALAPPIRTGELDRLAAAEAARRFDLRRWPLLRTTLVRLGESEHALLLTVHHIVADGWSLGILFGELAALYAAALAASSTSSPDFSAAPAAPVLRA